MIVHLLKVKVFAILYLAKALVDLTIVVKYERYLIFHIQQMCQWY